MSAPVLITTLVADLTEAPTRTAHNLALAQDLRERMAQAGLGGERRLAARSDKDGQGTAGSRFDLVG